MTALPATMTAIEISEPGGPEVLKPATRPVPLPGAGEVLIEVSAAGVNRPDVMQRQGNYPPPATSAHTASPGVNRLASAPRSTTVPASSRPGISGAPGGGG